MLNGATGVEETGACAPLGISEASTDDWSFALSSDKSIPQLAYILTTAWRTETSADVKLAPGVDSLLRIVVTDCFCALRWFAYGFRELLNFPLIDGTTVSLIGADSTADPLDDFAVAISV